MPYVTKFTKMVFCSAVRPDTLSCLILASTLVFVDASAARLRSTPRASVNCAASPTTAGALTVVEVVVPDGVDVVVVAGEVKILEPEPPPLPPLDPPDELVVNDPVLGEPSFLLLSTAQTTTLYVVPDVKLLSVVLAEVELVLDPLEPDEHVLIELVL